MRVHLVDATYELFRAHFAPRPPTLAADGTNLSGVAGLIDQLLYLLREEGATHSELSTDSRTGALDLYRKVGMEVTQTWTHLVMDLPRA